MTASLKPIISTCISGFYIYLSGEGDSSGNANLSGNQGTAQQENTTTQENPIKNPPFLGKKKGADGDEEDSDGEERKRRRAPEDFNEDTEDHEEDEEEDDELEEDEDTGPKSVDEESNDGVKIPDLKIVSGRQVKINPHARNKDPLQDVYSQLPTNPSLNKHYYTFSKTAFKIAREGKWQSDEKYRKNTRKHKKDEASNEILDHYFFCPKKETQSCKAEMFFTKGKNYVRGREKIVAVIFKTSKHSCSEEAAAVEQENVVQLPETAENIVSEVRTEDDEPQAKIPRRSERVTVKRVFTEPMRLLKRSSKSKKIVSPSRPTPVESSDQPQSQSPNHSSLTQELIGPEPSEEAAGASLRNYTPGSYTRRLAVNQTLLQSLRSAEETCSGQKRNFEQDSQSVVQSEEKRYRIEEEDHQELPSQDSFLELVSNDPR